MCVVCTRLCANRCAKPKTTGIYGNVPWEGGDSALVSVRLGTKNTDKNAWELKDRMRKDDF